LNHPFIVTRVGKTKSGGKGAPSPRYVKKETTNSNEEPTNSPPKIKTTQHDAKEHIARLKQDLIGLFDGKMSLLRSQIHQAPKFNLYHSVRLPVARIKKIMKSDEDVRMISVEAPVLLAKACELLLMELTLKAAWHAGKEGRRAVAVRDLARALAESETHDFLLDLVPEEAYQGVPLSDYQKGLICGGWREDTNYQQRGFTGIAGATKS
jgi:nuclear transcription factor Y gamma